MYIESRDTNDVLSKYLAFCKQAASNDDSFLAFRRAEDYTPVLEHVSEEQGHGYIAEIKATKQELLQPSYLEKFKKNDLIGAPLTFDYPGLGEFSPTTLRYIKVGADLSKNFFDQADIKINNIIEIGGGYGGQASILSEICDFKPGYFILDLPEVCPLIRKYLSKKQMGSISVSDDVESVSEQIQGKNNLVISNYAFSEISRKHQDIYIEKIFSQSNYFYFTNNYIFDNFDTLEDNQRGRNQEEMIATFKNLGFQVELAAEKPLTHPNNYILTGKRTRN